MICRFSSRRQRLDHAFLAETLWNAKSYDRIAGYFRSSIFEWVGEEIAAIPKVRIVCNSELDAADVIVSKHVRETALTFQWQVELKDRLGIPSAVWSSNEKVWVDPNGHMIMTRGAEGIARCSFRIAIVSTGLMNHRFTWSVRLRFSLRPCRHPQVFHGCVRRDERLEIDDGRAGKRVNIVQGDQVVFHRQHLRIDSPTAAGQTARQHETHSSACCGRRRAGPCRNRRHRG